MKSKKKYYYLLLSCVNKYCGLFFDIYFLAFFVMKIISFRMIIETNINCIEYVS